MTDTTIVKLNNRIWELEKENEELKQENKKLQGKYDNQLWLFNGLGCEYDWLKKENGELKQQNKKLKSENLELSQGILKGLFADENEELKHECNYLQDRLDDFVNVQNENEQLKQQLSSINQLIDNKIDEFKNGDYGDLPCNTIHMFLDLKQEIGDVE